MGQEQSSDALPAVGTEGGVQLVQGTGAALSGPREKDAVDKLVETSRSLRLPQQILPPPPVKDDVSSALQGAQVMHDLRSVLGGLFLGNEESPGLRQAGLSRGQAGDSRQSRSDEADNAGNTKGEGASVEEGGDVGEEGNMLQKKISTIDEFSQISEEDIRAEQERWARLGLNEESVNAVLETCTGGGKMATVLDRQEILMSMILALKEKSIRLRLAMDKNGEEAKRTTQVLERLDRLNVTLADVQEGLESAVATANILGASHFSHDDEMCSFKNFLRYNPPNKP